MKKACLYLLFIALVLSNTSFNEVFKLPALVTHYIEHHRLDNNVGIIRFLSMHYWGEDINDNDQDKDMQLPFKKADAYTGFQLAVPVAKPVFEKQQFFIKVISRPVSQDNNLSNPALESLFRPPRI